MPADKLKEARMTEEEYFRKHYPDVCYNDKPLSPYWDLFQDGVEYGERQSEKKIEELENQNRLLGERCNQLLEDKGDLTDKIEKMKCCYNCFYDCEDCNSKNKDCDKCPCGTCIKHNHWELRR